MRLSSKTLQKKECHMADSLDINVRDSLAKAVGVRMDERSGSLDAQTWWDDLSPKDRGIVAKKLGSKWSEVTVVMRKEFSELDEAWQDEISAYWSKHEKRKSKDESVLGERFTSSSARAAGKETASSLGKLAAADETFIKSHIKSMMKRIMVIVDEVHAEAQKKEKKVRKQDVANVLAMMIRQGIEKETSK